MWWQHRDLHVSGKPRCRGETADDAWLALPYPTYGTADSPAGRGGFSGFDPGHSDLFQLSISGSQDTVD